MPNESVPKKLGHCTQCDALVFEVNTRFPDDHPLARRVRSVGKALPEARRAYLLLTSGVQMPVTFCDKCVDNIDLKNAWKRILAALAEELDPEYRTWIGAKPYTDKQLEQAQEVYRRAAKEVPLGVLYMRRWLQES